MRDAENEKQRRNIEARYNVMWGTMSPHRTACTPCVRVYVRAVVGAECSQAAVENRGRVHGIAAAVAVAGRLGLAGSLALALG